MVYPKEGENCTHIGAKLKRVGIQHTLDTNCSIYLVQCADCGSTISTETLRRNKKLYAMMMPDFI